MLIMPLQAWDTAGWKCWIKVPHLLRSLLFMLDTPGQWKGTILYFPTVLKDQGQVAGKKGKSEVGRYPNVPLEYVMLYERDVAGMLRVISVLSLSSLL